MRIQAIVLASILLSAGTASAAGFLLNDHGAKATGRMDAVTATVTDGSAIFYNPGGIAVEDGAHFYFGANSITPNASYEPWGSDSEDSGDAGEVDTTTGTAFTPSAYVSYKVMDMLAVGFGFNTPFGLRVEWGENSPGRGSIREQSLRTFFLSPVVGLDLGQWVPGLTIGGGVDFVPATLKLKRDILFGEDVGTAELGGTAFGIGGRVGLMYTPAFNPGVHVGVAWRSSVKLDAEGEGDFDAPAAYRGALPPDGDIALELTLPQSLLIGFALDITKNFQIELDYNWIDWSVYKELAITLPGDPDTPGCQTFEDERHHGGETAHGDRCTVARKNWHDTNVFRLGMEYSIPSIGLDLRAGLGNDPTPIPDTTLDFTLPDIDRFVVSAGASYQLPANMWVDLGLLYVLPGENSTSEEPNHPVIKGDFEVSALVAGLSIGGRFGAAEEAPAAE